MPHNSLKQDRKSGLRPLIAILAQEKHSWLTNHFSAGKQSIA